MRIQRTKATNSAFLTTILLPGLVAAVGNLDCSSIVTDGKPWDLSALKGPHSVLVSHNEPPSIHNITYTIDICHNLQRAGDAPKGDACPSYTRVCRIDRLIKDGDGTDGKGEVTKVIPIAGNLRDFGGGDLDAKPTRFKGSDATADAGKEGLRIVLNGGKFPLDASGRKQKAVVEFICDRERTGLEHDDYDPEDKYKDDEKRGLDYRADNGTSTKASLRFVDYGPQTDESDTDVLRLEWLTKYACEDQKSKDDAEKPASWGFFAWFLIIAFLSTAAYIIFGSWLNYNRYGARGWDLLPHGDTIRDVPYLLKDWARKVLSTVQGGGSRGGYSAV